MTCEEKYERLLIKYKDLDKRYKNEVRKNQALTFLIWHRFKSYLASIEGLLSLDIVKNSENAAHYQKTFNGFTKEIKKFADKYMHKDK